MNCNSELKKCKQREVAKVPNVHTALVVGAENQWLEIRVFNDLWPIEMSEHNDFNVHFRG